MAVCGTIFTFQSLIINLELLCTARLAGQCGAWLWQYMHGPEDHAQTKLMIASQQSFQ